MNEYPDYKYRPRKKGKMVPVKDVGCKVKAPRRDTVTRSTLFERPSLHCVTTKTSIMPMTCSNSDRFKLHLTIDAKFKENLSRQKMISMQESGAQNAVVASSTVKREHATLPARVPHSPSPKSPATPESATFYPDELADCITVKQESDNLDYDLKSNNHLPVTTLDELDSLTDLLPDSWPLGNLELAYLDVMRSADDMVTEESLSCNMLNDTLLSGHCVSEDNLSSSNVIGVDATLAPVVLVIKSEPVESHFQFAADCSTSDMCEVMGTDWLPIESIIGAQ